MKRLAFALCIAGCTRPSAPAPGPPDGASVALAGFDAGTGVAPVRQRGVDDDLTDEELRAAHGDLELTARLAPGSSADYVAGDHLEVDAALWNRSGAPRWAGKPLDGPVETWTGPHVFTTARAERSPGVWVELPRRTIAGSDMADSRKAAAVLLAPGESLPLAPLSPRTLFEFQDAGRVRLRVHYADGDARAVSPAIELRVRTPLALQVLVKKPLAATRPVRLGDVLAVVVSNHSAAAMELASPLAAGGGLEFEVKHSAGKPLLDPEHGRGARTLALVPGARTDLLDAFGLEGTWARPGLPEVELRAHYTTPLLAGDAGPARGATTEAFSDWVVVPVEP